MKARMMNPWPDRLFKLALLALALLWFHVPPSSIDKAAKSATSQHQILR